MADETTTQTPTSGQIMDVAAPLSAAPATSINVQNQDQETVPAIETSSEPQASQAPAEEPAVNEEQTPEDTSNSPEPSPVTEDSAAAQPQPDAPAVTPPLGTPVSDKSAHQRRKPIGVIVVAIIIALVLAGLSVYAWQKSKQAVPKTSSNTPAVSQKVATTAVRPSDVDQTGKAVDNSLNQLNDVKDLSTNDLSNATLGL